MPIPAFLLRCLLALALVAGGMPTYGMAGTGAVEAVAAPSGCHDAVTEPHASIAPSTVNADCCGSADCLCDCLHHMPGVVFALLPITAPEFVAVAPVSRALPRYGHLPATSLRPPIG